MTSTLQKLLTLISIIAILLLGESPISFLLDSSTVENHQKEILSQDKNQKIDSLLQLYTEYGQFNGSVLVAEQGDVIFKEAYGLANREWNIDNKIDTKYRLASVSKQFTAMLIVQLAEKGVLNLDSTISHYLPSYPKKTGEKINIHQLLTHTSGIPNYTSFPNYGELMNQNKTPHELVKMFADSSLQFTPGERFSYSNSGYAVLGLIMETVTGNSFEEILKSQILDPLGMKNTGYDKHDIVLSNRAAGYHKNGSRYVNSKYIDMSIAYTAGGLYSTVEDLFLWDQALYTEKLLSKKYRDLVFSEQIPAWGAHYGYGWNIGSVEIGNTRERVATIDHDGVINGFNSMIIRIPSSNSTIIILANSMGASLYRMATSITGILHEKSYNFPKKSLAITVQEMIQKDGLVEAEAKFQLLRKSDKYSLDEREMNMIAYDFLGADKLKEAEFIMQENIKAFPHSSNVYDSYGELLLKMGKTELALKNYKKSVEYNPKNEHGRKILKEHGLTDEELENLSLELFKSDDEWKHEIFHFPLNFASEIPYVGREDARFPAGWRKPESNDFWSYTFAWYIEESDEMTVEEVETNLSLYFDGLADAVNKDRTKTLPKTKANFKKTATTNGIEKMNGTLDMYDSFVTNDAMKLYVTLENYFCAKQNRRLLLFRFSPKDYDHEIWKKLNQVSLREGICK